MSYVGAKALYTPLTYNGNTVGNNYQTPDPQDAGGDFWDDVDNLLGCRRFAFVYNNGATTTAVANGAVVYWTDHYGAVVSTKQADSARNCARGVGIGAISAANYGWVQTDGYHGAVLADSSTFALGDKAEAYSTDGEVTDIAAGTAPTYTVIGSPLAASSGTPKTVKMLLHVGKNGYNP